MTDPTRLILRRPDDWHVHLRDGAMLEAVAPSTARQFARAIVMPNLDPPVTDGRRGRGLSRPNPRGRRRRGLHAADDLLPDRRCRSGRARIAASRRASSPRPSSTPPMRRPTRLTESPTIANIHPALEAMQRIGMPLLVHGEVTDPGGRHLRPREGVHRPHLLGLLRDFPALKMVFEHITTADAAEFVLAAGPNVAATVTPHHLHINRNALFAGGLRPACLLPAGRQARSAPPGRPPGRHVGLAQILPRHRQRAARGRAQGVRLRLRRHLQRPVRAGKLRGSVRGGGRAGSAGSVRVGERPAFLRAAAQRGAGGAEQRSRVPKAAATECVAPSTPADTLGWWRRSSCAERSKRPAEPWTRLSRGTASTHRSKPPAAFAGRAPSQAVRFTGSAAG